MTAIVLTPMTTSQGYQPEINTTLELDAKRAISFQGFIGVLRCWICELGRIEILVGVAMLLPSWRLLQQGRDILIKLSTSLQTGQPVEHGL